MLRTAKNGCASIVYYRGKIVYHYWHEGIPLENLGEKQNKIKYIGENVDPENVEKVKKMIRKPPAWHVHGSGQRRVADHRLKNYPAAPVLHLHPAPAATPAGTRLRSPSPRREIFAAHAAARPRPSLLPECDSP